MTNEELALIDTLMYCRGITDETGNLESVLKKKFFGDENIVDLENAVFNAEDDRFGYPDELEKVVRAILANEELCELEIMATSTTYQDENNLSDTSGVLALCLCKVDENNPKNATDMAVIYAGDYYSEADDGLQLGWHNVLSGGMEEHTDGQEFALKFLEDMYDKYGVVSEDGTKQTSVTVSGHSAGGNYSSYVTILSNIVDYCFAFDAQGLSSEFMRNHTEELEANSSKIVAYSSNTDIVTCLLNMILDCSERKFLSANSFDTSEWGIMTGHLPFVVFNYTEDGQMYFTEEGDNTLFQVLNPLSLTIVNNSSAEINKESFERFLNNVSSLVYYIINPGTAEADNVDLPSLLLNVDTYHVMRASVPEILDNVDLITDYPILGFIADTPVVKNLLTKDAVDEVVSAYFGEDIADAVTEMRADITRMTEELKDLAVICIFDFAFGDLMTSLIGEKYDEYMGAFISELKEDVKQHYINFFTCWADGAEMIGDAASEALNKFIDGVGCAANAIGDFFSELFGVENDGVIIGTDGADELFGTDEQNVIYGNDGNDVIYGYAGNDVILGGADKDKLYGGEDSDVLYGENGSDEIHGENGNDELYGGMNHDTLYGNDGVDKLFGEDGSDTLYGGADADELFGGVGNDTIYGQAGDDYIESGNGNNYLYGGDGDDTIVTGEDTDRTHGGAGNDYVIGGNGDNYMYGEDGDDRLQGGEGYDYMDGGLGSDDLSGGNGFNEMYGQEGDDKIYGGDHADYIDGGVGDDHLYGANATDGQNEIYGREGNDTIYDGDQGASIEGNEGDDTIRAGGGNDVIDGGVGNDYIQDDHGDDTVIFKAGYGTDTISDAAGNNMLVLSGLSIEDATAYKEGSDLKLAFSTGDNLIIKQYFDGGAFQNFSIDGVLLGDLISGYHGTENDDWMSASNGNDTTLYGDGGNDNISGNNGSDTLYGGSGNDTLNGDENADMLDGGEGTDFLYGGNGDDTYVFGKGYGSDTIEDWNGSSIVKLTDINIDEVSISNSNDSALVLTVDSTGDTLTINGYKWNQGGYTFEFADGTTDTVDKDTWNWESGFGTSSDDTTGDSTGEGETTQPDVDVTDGYVLNGSSNGEWLSAPNNDSGVIDAGDGDDGLNGGSGSDKLYGGAGTDNLYGNDGDDILDGGIGTDGLNGGNGTDTYIFAKGYGNDTVNEWGSDITVIKLTEINPDEVTLNSQSENNLVISVNGTSDTLTISNYRWSQGSFTLEFADGAIATVNKETWGMEYSQYPTVVTEETAVTETESSVSETALEIVVAEASDEDVVQSNAETLTAIYMMDSPLATTFADETDNTIISEVTDSTTVADESDEIADQTDLQVMILTENMSAFADEDNVSDGINVADASAEVTAMNQLLVNSAV